MTIVHYLCHNWRRHLAYACLSAESLITRGEVDPSMIVVSLSATLMSSPEAEAMKGLGVRLFAIPDGWTQKILALGNIFRLMPKVSRIIQLDGDTVLTEPCDYFNRIEELAGDNLLSVYRGDRDAMRQYRNRFSLFLAPFNPGEPQGRQRLSSLMRALAHVSLEEFEGMIAAGPWILGGLTVWHRKVMERPAWSIMQALAWICRCDETVIRIAGARPWHTGLPIGELDREAFPHRVDPEQLSLTHGPGMVHYAGDWYREHNASNRAHINAALVGAFGLTLPVDAPVGPRKAGDPDPTKPGWPQSTPGAVPGGDSRPLSPPGGTL